MTILLFIGGLIGLIIGAELLVRGASKLALSFGISPLVVGLTSSPQERRCPRSQHRLPPPSRATWRAGHVLNRDDELWGPDHRDHAGRGAAQTRQALGQHAMRGGKTSF